MMESGLPTAKFWLQLIKQILPMEFLYLVDLEQRACIPEGVGKLYFPSFLPPTAYIYLNSTK